jgi:hypothetical protein
MENREPTSDDCADARAEREYALKQARAAAARRGAEDARRDLAAAHRNIAAGFPADPRTVARDARDAGDWAMPTDEGIADEAADAYCEAYDTVILEAADAEEAADSDA